MNRMRHALRVLWLAVAIALAPAGYWLGGYFAGRGWFREFEGILVSLFSMMLVPLITLVVLLVKVERPWIRKLKIAFAVVGGQVLLLWLVPHASSADLLGRAHRWRAEFSPQTLKTLAAELHEKHRQGALTHKKKPEGFWAFVETNAIVVERAELRPELRGEFAGVFLQRGRMPSEAQTVFAVNERTGVFLGTVDSNRRPYVHPMDDGVHAYYIPRP